MSLPEDPNDPFFSDQPEALPPAQPAEEAGASATPAAAETGFESDPSAAAALPPAAAVRRRRQRRLAAVGSPEFLNELAHQGTPSFDFFLFSLLAGVVLVAAILTGAPALYILAALLAPFMAPLVGISLSAAAGSVGFFLRSVASLMIGALMAGVIGGVGGILWGQSGLSPQAYSEALSHAVFSWPDLIVLLLGTVITLYMVGRSSRSRPLVSSVALAYELYLPLGVAGFGLAAGLPDALWQGGLLVFAAHVALAGAAGALVLLLMGLHPARAAGWLAAIVLFGGMAGGAGVVLASGIGWSNAAASPTPQATPVASLPTRSPAAQSTLLPASATLPLPTPEPLVSDTPEPSRTPTSTVAPTPTASQTLAPSPTPVWGLVSAGEYKGAIIRPEPGSTDQVTSLLNGAVLQILPEIVNKGGVIWLHVRTPDGKEGWVQSSLILTATPVP